MHGSIYFDTSMNLREIQVSSILPKLSFFFHQESDLSYEFCHSLSRCRSIRIHWDSPPLKLTHEDTQHRRVYDELLEDMPICYIPSLQLQLQPHAKLRAS